MTRDDIIRMALEAGIEYSKNLNQMASPYCDGVHMDELEIFFKKAFEAGSVAEREACAKVCDRGDPMVKAAMTQFECAQAIRARGQE